MKSVAVIVVLFLSYVASAQSGKTILEKVKLQYAKPQPLSFLMSYNLYKTWDSKKVYESYDGRYKKNAANDIYLNVNNTEIITTNKFSLQVDNNEKIIVLSKTGAIDNQTNSIVWLLSLFDKSFSKDKGTYWEIELKGKSLSQLPYDKVIIHVGKDYLIRKQILYYGKTDFSTNFSKSDNQYPRLEIIFGKAARNTQAGSDFNIYKYLDLTKSKVCLKGIYKKYQLIDQR